jgi:hypothetical protein
VTFTPPKPGAAAARDERPGAEPDPAHGGPLDHATLPELIGRLINDVSDLADRQIELAKQEIGEAKDHAVSAAIRIAIGGGIAAAAALLLVIWAWTAFIWFFNWLGGLIVFETPLGPQSWAVILGALVGVIVGAAIGPGVAGLVGLPGGPAVRGTLGAVLCAIVGALVAWAAGLGWLFGVLVPGVAAWVAYARFIRGGIRLATSIWPPLPRTRETLKEDLEWVKHLRTRSAR